ncbi:poly(A) polymerase I-like [Thalictrum thalictroides]|uniref:Poly(A) polymerase I-like n=1 Tax=Thalictrum thalictroides TaxID=46969 RepID=A0A7J6X475_THATH|nr:poly(A) polymerase I-like [Thalictrum thalictroides]
MAISGFGFAACYRTHFSGLLRPTPPFLYCVRKVRRSSAASVETFLEPENSVFVSSDKRGKDEFEGPNWKKISTNELGITTQRIAKPTRVVLNALRRKGYEVYLVGGCVRDLILNRTPKDYDILTSAELREVVRTFAQCEIVGKRFPICHVHISCTIIEVSSFSTTSRKSSISNFFRRPSGCDEQDYRRWKNCLRRDFTINGLMLDPYAKLVYDYFGGMEDIRNAKVRTVIPADSSFREDCARILRGIRIAARLGFRFSKEAAYSIKDLSYSIMKLDKGRLLMEMNYMLAYGSAEASLRLLWKVGLLDILLPIQAAYFVSQGFRRRDKRSNMLLSLFSNLDKLLAPDKPCHGSLWGAILAFHIALSDHPRDPLVVAAFSLAIYNGGDLLEAVKIAKSISQSHDNSFPELLRTQEVDLDDVVMSEVMDLATSVLTAVSWMTDESFVSQAMAKYPQAPYSNLVFISLGLYMRVCKIFYCLKHGNEDFITKRRKNIDYEYLAVGNLQEVRHVFARVVFDTVYPLHLREQNQSG